MKLPGTTSQNMPSTVVQESCSSGVPLCCKLGVASPERGRDRDRERKGDTEAGSGTHRERLPSLLPGLTLGSHSQLAETKSHARLCPPTVEVERGGSPARNLLWRHVQISD